MGNAELIFAKGTNRAPAWCDQPFAIEQDYYGKWRPYVPGTKDTYALEEAERWDHSFRVKVDYPESFGYAEFVGSTWDETVESTANKMHLRNLPWMRVYYRYDDGRGGPEFDTEWWSCQFKRGRSGGPCWQYPDY